jgi:hypothetical protein
MRELASEPREFLFLPTVLFATIAARRVDEYFRDAIRAFAARLSRSIGGSSREVLTRPGRFNRDLQRSRRCRTPVDWALATISM